MLSGHVEKIDSHTEELKDGIAQDGSHGVNCGGGAGQLPVEVVIAYAYTEVQVTRHGRFALWCKNLQQVDSAEWMALCV
jgi:hypothetical protein